MTNVSFYRYHLFTYFLKYIFSIVVIVVFDLTDEESLQHTVKWMEDACLTADDPVKFLVGTKKDLLVGFLL